MILNFNLHDIFKFRVIGENKRFLNYLEKEYSFFKVNGISNPDLVVIIGKFKPNNSNCSIINHKYYIKKNYIYCRDSYKVVRWSVQISNLERKKIIVHFDGNFFADSFLCRYIIEPIMRFKMNQKGYTFLHSSGISDGKQAFLLSACKGVGKTSTVLHLVNEGRKFLSDDFTILSKKGIVWSYPTTIHLFEYNLKGCPFVFKKLRFKDKILVKLYDYVYKLTLKYGQLPLDVNVENIFSNVKIGKSYPLRSLILLTKTNKDKIKVKKITNGHDLVKRLISINKFEAFHFFDYMLAYSFIFPNGKVAVHWETLEKNLLSALEKSPCYRVDVPKNYTFKVFKKIKSILTTNGYLE